jgi:tetratricopeptide (TPR) repeat protein
MQRYAEAEPLYREALEIYRHVVGEQHPDYARSLNNLGFLYYSMGRDAEAEPLYRQALEVFLNVLGPQHPLSKTCQTNYDALRQRLASNRRGR